MFISLLVSLFFFFFFFFFAFPSGDASFELNVSQSQRLPIRMDDLQSESIQNK